MQRREYPTYCEIVNVILAALLVAEKPSQRGQRETDMNNQNSNEEHSNIHQLHAKIHGGADVKYACKLYDFKIKTENSGETEQAPERFGPIKRH
jgi:hypothetical protein